MENWIINLVREAFLKHYGLQDAFKSEDRLVSKEAIQMLSKLTGIRENYLAENGREIIKISNEQQVNR